MARIIININIWNYLLNNIYQIKVIRHAVKLKAGLIRKRPQTII